MISSNTKKSCKKWNSIQINIEKTINKTFSYIRFPSTTITMKKIESNVIVVLGSQSASSRKLSWIFFSLLCVYFSKIFTIGLWCISRITILVILNKVWSRNDFIYVSKVEYCCSHSVFEHINWLKHEKNIAAGSFCCTTRKFDEEVPWSFRFNLLYIEEFTDVFTIL